MIQILLMDLGAGLLSFLITSVSAVRIPDSPASLDVPPDPYWGG